MATTKDPQTLRALEAQGILCSKCGKPNLLCQCPPKKNNSDAEDYDDEQQEQDSDYPEMPINTTSLLSLKLSYNGRIDDQTEEDKAAAAEEAPPPEDDPDGEYCAKEEASEEESATPRFNPTPFSVTPKCVPPGAGS